MSLARCLLICGFAAAPFVGAMQHVSLRQPEPEPQAMEFMEELDFGTSEDGKPHKHNHEKDHEKDHKEEAKKKEPVEVAEKTSIAIAIGDHVRPHDLLKAVELNGKYGEVVDFDSSTGRYIVTLGDSVMHRLKPENLEVLPKAKFAKGSNVQAHDLKKTATLNGLIGTVDDYDYESDRFVVRFAGDDALHRIKTENLEQARPTPVEEVAVVASSNSSSNKTAVPVVPAVLVHHNAFDVVEITVNVTANATEDEAKEPCKCLSFAEAYKTHKVTCGQTFEYSRGGGAKALNIVPWSKDEPEMRRMADIYGKEVCELFTSLDVNTCVMAKYQARPEMHMGSWCYVSDKCEKLNGGALVTDSSAAWKQCDPQEDTFLGDWPVAEVLKLSKLLNVNAGLLTGFAYPTMSFEQEDISDGSADKAMRNYRAGLPVIFANHGVMGDKTIIDGREKTWRMSLVKVDAKAGLWKSTCKTEDDTPVDCTPYELQPPQPPQPAMVNYFAPQQYWNPWTLKMEPVAQLPQGQQPQGQQPQQQQGYPQAAAPAFPFWR